MIGEGFKIYYLQLLKPIPIMLMIYYIHDKNKAREHLVPRLIEFGLIFSLVGDVCLMSNDITSFLIGTLFFMVGHSVYIFAFRVGEKVKQLKRGYKQLRTGTYIVVVILLILNIFTLWDKFPSKIIFAPYCAILALEIIVTLSRYEKSENSSFYFILIGAALFTISDNLLGFLKFNAIRTDLGRSIIMITYYGAQYFFMHGGLHQSNLVYDTSKESQKKIY